MVVAVVLAALPIEVEEKTLLSTGKKRRWTGATELVEVGVRVGVGAVVDDNQDRFREGEEGEMQPPRYRVAAGEQETAAGRW